MKKFSNFPKVTFCVITYNEEQNIERCLISILSQHYPKDKIEIILVDDDSTDNTLKIAKKYPVKIFKNGKKDPDLSLAIGFNKSSGEYFSPIAPDMLFRNTNWIKKMTQPLIENSDIPVAFTRYYSHPKESLITRYLSLDPIQRDLVYQLFSPGFEKVIEIKRKDYYICRYSKKQIVPQVHGIYRIRNIKNIIRKQKTWYDMGNLICLLDEGYTKFAYVPDAGYYHFHVNTITSLVKKRLRNINRGFLRNIGKPRYQWFNLNSSKDILKIIFLILCANLILPIFIFSLYRIVRHRNWLYILDAPITILLVNIIIYGFISDRRGRKMINQAIFNIIK